MQAGSDSIGLEEREGSVNFTGGFYGSFVQYKMDFLRLRERETLDLFVLCRKHHWLLPQRSIVRDFRPTSIR